MDANSYTISPDMTYPTKRRVSRYLSRTKAARMELLQDEAFDKLFSSFEDSAFHLEVQDSYHTPEEAGPFALFLRGEPDDFGWHEPWLTVVREATRAGKRIERVRIVSEPHVDYTRWGLTVAELNIKAGEDIRWLPRHLTTTMPLTHDDFWLFDDVRVVFTVFAPGGRFVGGAQTTDPVLVDHCRQTRDLVWAAAIRHHDYITK